MAQTQERPRIITEIQVRVDCNGCVQKIKKALKGINGISDVYIDLPRQKLTIVGWADPERIIRAVKKARKNATIYSHSELQEPPSQQSDSAPPVGEAPPPLDDSNPPADNQPQPPQPEPPKDQQTQPNPPEPRKDQQPPPPENPATREPAPENPPACEPPSLPVHPNESQHHHRNAVEEVHVIHHHPPDHSNRSRAGYGPGYEPIPPGYNRVYDQGPPDYSPDQPRYSQRYGPGYNPGPPNYSQVYNPSYGSRTPSFSQGYNEPSYNPGPPDHSQEYEPSYNPGPPSHSRSHGYGGDWSGRPEPNYRPERPQPVQVTHSYNQYRPAPYVTQYGYVQSPPRYTPYGRTEDIQSQPRYAPYASTESNYYYNNGDYQSNDSSNGYMASLLSEENPNACTIS